MSILLHMINLQYPFFPLSGQTSLCFLIPLKLCLRMNDSQSCPLISKRQTTRWKNWYRGRTCYITPLSLYRGAKTFQHGKIIYRGRICYVTAANDIDSELILRFKTRWKTNIEVMVGKTNTEAKYSTKYENAFVNNFETHGAWYLPALVGPDYPTRISL